MVLILRTSFNTNSITHSKCAIQNTLYWLYWPTFWRETSRGESRWDGEKWPFIFDGNEREGELTVIQTAFHADPRLRISHTGSECGVLGGQWPLPTRPPEKRLSKKKDTLYLNDVWLPLRVKCSLHNWKHLPALRWFHYHYGSSCWCKGSTFPLNTFRWWNMDFFWGADGEFIHIWSS